MLTFLVATLINRNKCFSIIYYEQNAILKVIEWFYMFLYNNITKNGNGFK